jgi:hypothetical protein
VPRRWSHDWYLEYLHQAETWGTAAGFQTGDIVRSDVVEFALFSQGRRSARQRRRKDALLTLKQSERQ